MTTIKSYTDIEQSRKLAEILPLESADMYYVNGDIGKIIIGKWKDETHDEDDISCWSLTALLRIIPKRLKEFNVLRIDIGEESFSIWYDEVGYGVNAELPNITTEYPVDACYEMIIKLKEQNLL